MADEQGSDEVHKADDIGRTKITPRHVVLIVVATLLVVLAVLNLDDVSVDLLVGSVEMPLVVVIAIVAGLGFLIGWLLARRHERRRRD